MAEGRVLIVDKDPGRRAALRADLALPEGEVAVLADPSALRRRLAQLRPDLLLDIDGPDDPGLEGLRRLRAGPGDHLPAVAPVPPGRPELRLAALAAGADDASERGTPARLLQARVRRLLRQRDDALALSPAGGREGA